MDNTLYRRGVDSILCRFLTHEEDEVVLNDCHGGACGGHLSGLSTAQNILKAGYFWSSIGATESGWFISSRIRLSF